MCVVGGCQPRPKPDTTEQKSAPKREQSAPRRASASAPLRVRGELSAAQLEQLTASLEACADDQARLALLKGALSEALMSVASCAELLSALETEEARLSALDALRATLVEEAQEERHALLDLFERPELRARAVDQLGWH
jgi:hypothetical protein